jgi:multidrug efflux pump subunit AcrA (membrane-fusion protein)
MNPVRQGGLPGLPGPPAQDAQAMAEIADLAASPVPEPVFLHELLKRAVDVLGAAAGVVWMFDAQRRLVLQCEVRLQSTGFIEDLALRSAFEQPFAEVLRAGGVVAHDAERATLRDGISRCSALLGGLQRDTEVSGLVQIFEGRGAAPEGRNERLRLLEQICGLATRYWQQRNAVATQAVAAPGTASAEQWSLAVHESLSTLDVAVIAANECRRALGVDRLTVAERHGPRVKVLAVSGQPSVNARSNAVRLLAQLSEQVLDTGEKLTFTGETRNLPPQIEKLLADYLHESRSRAVVVLPVTGPAPREDEKTSTGATLGKPPDKPDPVGVLVVEQISETPLPADLDARLDRVAAHVGLALRNAQIHDRIFLMPVWEFLGDWKARLKGRRLAQIGTVLAVAAAIVLSMLFIPWDFRVSGKGQLMPIDRRAVFAPWDGEVVKLYAQSGKPVKKGELLVELKNDELRGKLLLQENTLLEKKKQAASIAAQLNDPETAKSPATKIELRGKHQQLNVEIEGAKEQVASLTRQVEALTVRAPISGVVATFRLEEMLRHRPVKFGDLLLEVMNPDGPWRLELDVPESRLGHILQAQQKSGDDRLAVRYKLATATEQTYEGLLDEVSTRSAVSEGEGAVVSLYASLTEPTPPSPRIGAEVNAKINCGKKSLGYFLFGDVIEFIRKRFWL